MVGAAARAICIVQHKHTHTPSYAHTTLSTQFLQISFIISNTSLYFQRDHDAYFTKQFPTIKIESISGDVSFELF